MNKKVIALILVIAIALGMFAGCKKKGGNEKGAAVINGTAVTRPIFAYAFNEALNNLYYENNENVDFNLFGTIDFFNALKNNKNSDGITYYEQLRDETLEIARKFIINMDMAKTDKNWPDKDALEKTKNDQRANVESTYSVYIESYGWTVDDIALQLFGMSMDDYGTFYGLSSAVDSFNLTKKGKINPTDAELESFYNENKDEYRTVTVRHSLILTQDMDETEKKAAYERAQSYVDAFKAGTMTYDEIVALSEDTGLASNDGYYDVCKDGQYVPEFENWAIACTEPSDNIEIVETSYGYHIMKCTGIKGYEDETVKNNVLEGFKADKIMKEIEELEKQSKYEIKNIDENTCELFMKQIITGNFTDPDATPTQEPSPTPKSNLNDAPASEDAVGKMGDIPLYYSDYVYFFSTAVSELVLDEIEFDDESTVAQRYEHLRNFLDGKYKDEDITYLEKCKNRAMDLLVEFNASYILAGENKTAYTEDEKAAITDEIDEMVDYYLSYYGEAYGASTRDAYSEYVMGMNVNEYKRFTLKQSFISDYAGEQMDAMKPSEDELRAYYDKNEDVYRLVTVRNITLSKLGEDGNLLSDDEIAKKKTLADNLIEKIKSGDSAEAIAKAWSEDDDVSFDYGLADITRATADSNDEMMQYLLAQTEIGAGTLKMFEDDSNIEIVMVEGILTYDEQKGITADEEASLDVLRGSVSDNFKNEAFQKVLEDYVQAHSYKASDRNEELISKAAEKFLTYEGDE